jgi:hypothetical protein
LDKHGKVNETTPDEWKKLFVGSLVPGQGIKVETITEE